MTETMTNADLVRRGYRAFKEADVDTLSGLFTDDAAWTTPGRSGIAGTARGKDAVLAQFGRYHGETQGTFRADLTSVCEGEDGRVIALHHNTGERNGKQLDADCCIVFEIQGGRVTAATEFYFDVHGWDQFWS